MWGRTRQTTRGEAAGGEEGGGGALGVGPTAGTREAVRGAGGEVRRGGGRAAAHLAVDGHEAHARDERRGGDEAVPVDQRLLQVPLDLREQARVGGRDDGGEHPDRIRSVEVHLPGASAAA